MVVTFTSQNTGKTGKTTLQPKHLLHKSYQRRRRFQDEDLSDVGKTVSDGKTDCTILTIMTSHLYCEYFLAGVDD